MFILQMIHHIHMTDYHQLSVVHKISGADYDGFALCGFASVEDIRERFFTEEASVQIIRDDVRTFADPKASPRRLITTPTYPASSGT